MGMDFILSYRKRQLCRTKSLIPPEHPVTATFTTTAIQDTFRAAASTCFPHCYCWPPLSTSLRLTMLHLSHTLRARGRAYKPSTCEGGARHSPCPPASCPRRQGSLSVCTELGVSPLSVARTRSPLKMAPLIIPDANSCCGSGCAQLARTQRMRCCHN